MSGIEVAGIVLGVVPITFKAAVEAWRTLDDAISFDDDTEDLIIRLETVKARLGIWATRAGLTDGELISSLYPVEELLERTVRRIRDLVIEVEQQGKKYGIVAKEPGESDSKRVTAAVAQMRRSLQSIITSSRSKTNLAQLAEREASLQSTARRGETGVSRRVYWAIRDKKKFEDFIDTLEKHVRGLQDFTVDTDRKEIRQEGTRLALEIIRGLSQPEALSRLRLAPEWDNELSQIDVSSLAQWKAIMQQRTPTLGMCSAGTEDWSLAGSNGDDRAKTRFLKSGHLHPEITYLFEKKEYDMNISDELKDLVRESIQKLVSLLGESSAQRKLHTLQAVGYVDDPNHHCCWIVFRFPQVPIGLSAPGPRASEPLSLHNLFSSPLKPPLEARYRLAKRLVDTFARLYGSEWMHKGINSNNVVFPQIYSPVSVQSFASIQTALVQGFNYSRQLTQAQTIDRGKVLNNLESAIYRHPYYQGEAASGYQIHYDIYSLGLVLLEIALWGPLMGLLAAKHRPGKEPPVALSPDMPRFHEVEAVELKRRVMIRVGSELAYRVGTKYKEVVRWCLDLEGPVTAIEFYNMVAIPLDELCGQG
ncbi:hypothetical protein PV04_05045 [Phialophora macrospora]|uniref:Prion-inhibition and propagation HeLo domain-containing protein n=1 Tax=Phialophora macrospora TaxID=1851006 RepID=A0A0D2E469_9EURO|nr:hypothetical protein PV04_05045 [Phialophora macrospora]